jgi:hypothetical protein
MLSVPHLGTKGQAALGHVSGAKCSNFGGNARLCKQCGLYSCHHSAFTGIHPSILPLKSIDALELGAQPARYATTVEASCEGLQPRRQQQQTVAEKAAGAEAKALGASQGCPTGGGGTKRRGRATQSVVAAKQPVPTDEMHRHSD